MRERLQQLIDTNEFEFLKTMSEEDIWKFAFAIFYVFSEREDLTGHCKDCKYCGEVLKDNLHNCNNNKSIFKTCLETATGCEKFEPQESEDNR